jgi:predicted porin
MNKKLLALAMAGIVGAPAVAEAQSVTIYGRLYPQAIVVNTRGPTAPGTTVSTLVDTPTEASAVRISNVFGVDASNSRLGFRGVEPLGDGMSAFFQIEQTVAIDTSGAALASRDSFVGVSSDKWGTVKLGNMDTVYKNLGDTLSFLGVSSGNIVSNSNILSKPGMGLSSSGSFHLRRANSVNYATPEISGFQALVTYSPDEAKTATRRADLWSVGAKYENGPIYAALAWERHNDFFGGSRNSRSALSNFSNQNADSEDDAIRATLQYKFGRHSVEGNVAYMEYDETGGQAGRFENYHHYAWNVALESRWSDAWRSAVGYARAEKGSCSLVGGASCSTEGLDGSQVSLGAAYYFSKRTYAFALFTKLWNGKSAVYNNMANFDPARGADIDQFALGVAHNF